MKFSLRLWKCAITKVKKPPWEQGWLSFFFQIKHLFSNSTVLPWQFQNLQKILKWTCEQSIKAPRCNHLEHTKHYESFKSLPLHNPFSMALLHSTRGVLVLDTRGGTSRINYASSVCVCSSSLVFCVCVWMQVEVEDFPLSAGPLHPSRASISLLDTHRSEEGVSLRLSWAPRVLQALRRSGMTFNQGSGSWAATGGPQEPWLQPSPQVRLSAACSPWGSLLGWRLTQILYSERHK